MAFSLFGKRKPDSETTDEGKDLETRGFFDRMKQAVTRTRDSFSESIGRCLRLRARSTRLRWRSWRWCCCGGYRRTTARTIIENLRQRALRQGIEGGEELKRLLKIETEAGAGSSSDVMSLRPRDIPK